MKPTAQTQNNDHNITINKLKVLHELDEIKKKLEYDEYIKELEQDEKIKQEAIEWIKNLNLSQQDKFMNVLYDTMEGCMIKRITDIFTRNVSSYLQIDSGTNIVADIKTELTLLELKIIYKDLVGNSYSPLVKKINILDERKDGQLKVNIPIQINGVNEDEAYKNVRSMVI